MLRYINKVSLIFCLMSVYILLFINVGYPLSTSTHRSINEHISKESFADFTLNDYLKQQLGMPKGYDEKINGKEVFKWISDGGEYEDKGIRSKNHFLNPLTNKGLYEAVFLPSALEWSLKPVGAQGEESYSWHDVRSYYYQALTTADKATRETNFAKTFRGMGHVMHLVQDMSVPAHTRDDQHIFGEGYETWGKEFLNEVNQVKAYRTRYFSSSGTLFLIPSLFDTDQYNGTNPYITTTSSTGIGLAEYANANFFSDDTIIYEEFPYPQISSEDRHVKQYTGPQGTYNREYFLKYCTEDDYCQTNSDKEYGGYLLAAVDYYDYWRQINSLPEDEYPPIPCLDENVFYDYSQFLIPRAIGYSMQALSYFFRGKMKLLPANPFSSGYVIQNNSAEVMEGEFRLYYDNINDVRVEIKSGDFPTTSMTIAANSTSATNINFEAPSDAKNPGEYMLVFRGKMGEELGAVAGAVVRQPLLLAVIEPGSVVLGDVEEKIVEYSNVLTAYYVYLNGQAQYWMDMFNVYISLGQYTLAINALQLSQAYAIIRDDISNEKVHWAQFLAGIKEIANAPAKFTGGSAATDFEGKLSELTAYYYAAYLDSSYTPSWDTMPKSAKTHTFITGPSFEGNPVMLLTFKTKAGEVPLSGQANILNNNIYFSAPFILNPQLTVYVDGLQWIQGPEGSWTIETNNIYTMDTLYHVEVWMSASIIDKNNFPNWNRTATMNLKLFSFDFKITEE